MTRASKSPPPAEEIQVLRDEGLNREEIADRYGVSLTTVKRWIKTYEIKKPSKAGGGRRTDQRSRRLPSDWGLTVLDKAKKILGDRLVEDRWKGYLLDGRPVRTDAVIAAAGLSYEDGPVRLNP